MTMLSDLRTIGNSKSLSEIAAMLDAAAKEIQEQVEAIEQQVDDSVLIAEISAIERVASGIEDASSYVERLADALGAAIG